ncbi:MAG: membrane protein insertion efficiency factor YidD [Sulfurovum sp.]|nr:membrane protein insertion efficiency factor YidD [Sulfurovum sp.]
MTLKNFYIAPIKGYQYISRMLPASCRYYPSCSEYAKWQLEFNTTHKALFASGLRILRCNQLFEGGIDYPLVKLTPKLSLFLYSPNHLYGKIKIQYWLIPVVQEHSVVMLTQRVNIHTPNSPQLHYIIKDIYDTYLEFTT